MAKDSYVSGRGRGRNNRDEEDDKKGKKRRRPGGPDDGGGKVTDPAQGALDEAARQAAAEQQRALVQQQLAQSNAAYQQAVAAQDQANRNVAFNNAPAPTPPPVITESNSSNPFAPMNVTPASGPAMDSRGGRGPGRGNNRPGRGPGNSPEPGAMTNDEYRLWQDNNQQDAYLKYLKDNIGIDPYAQNDYSKFWGSEFSRLQQGYNEALTGNQSLHFNDYLNSQMNPTEIEGRWRNQWADDNRETAIDQRLQARGFVTQGPKTNQFSNWLNTQGQKQIQDGFASAQSSNPSLNFSDYVNNYNTSKLRDDYASLDGAERGVKAARPGRWVAY